MTHRGSLWNLTAALAGLRGRRARFFTRFHERDDDTDVARAAHEQQDGNRELDAGRGERADILLAALVNAHAQSANAYNDTHLATVAHPTGPVAAPRGRGPGGAPRAPEA